MQNNIIKDYKDNKIDIFEAIHKLDTKDKMGGVIYTPKYIADYIVENLGYSPDKTIYEPAVGHGIFIFSLIEYVQKKFKLDNFELYNWFTNYVIGSDIIENNIEDLKKLTEIYFSKLGITDSNFDKNFTCYNTLNNKNIYVDFIFGNPPYIRLQNLDLKTRNNLKKNYISCKTGNVDIYYAFMEFGNKFSKEVCSYIVPNSYLYNSSAKQLRKLIKPNISEIIDFEDKKIFEGVGTYTSIFKIDKKKNKSNKQIKFKTSISDVNEIIIDKVDIIDKKPWNLKNIQKIIEKTSRQNKLINNNDVRATSGIATLRDHVYINSSSSLFEKSNFIPFYKLTKISNINEIKNPINKIICPYDNNWDILSESTIQNKCPKIYSHLKIHENDLEGRDSGNTEGYESWYAYGRKQGLHVYNKKSTLIFLSQMTNTNLNPIKTNINNIGQSRFLFSSGYVLEIQNKDKVDKIIEILKSDDFFEYIKMVGKVWPGKPPYYSFTITMLKEYTF